MVSLHIMPACVGNKDEQPWQGEMGPTGWPLPRAPGIRTVLLTSFLGWQLSLPQLLIPSSRVPVVTIHRKVHTHKSALRCVTLGTICQWSIGSLTSAIQYQNGHLQDIFRFFSFFVIFFFHPVLSFIHP